MINIYVREHILPYEFYNSQHSTHNATINLGSNIGTLYFYPVLLDLVASDWNGGMIIFTSGANAGLGANIASFRSEIVSGTLSHVMDLSEYLPATPEPGTTFILVRRLATSYISYGQTYQLDRYTTDVKVTTDIDKGYATASFKINNRFANIFSTFTAFVGMNIKIFEDGYQIFEGLIADVDYTGSGGSVSCVGYKQTFSWFVFEKIYNSDAGNTSPRILKDICAANPYIPNKLIGIDRGDVWQDIQNGIGGIGPRDYMKSIQTCDDALNDILQMGYFGISFDSTYLQFYNDVIPVLKVVSKDSEVVDWYIDRNNFIFGDDSFTLKSSILDAYTEVFTTFNDANGNTLNTASAVNVNFISKMGRRKKSLSVGEGGMAEKTAVVRVANNDFGTFLSSTSLKIAGKVGSGMRGTKQPVSHIKAGDVVTLSLPPGFDSMYKNTLVDVTTFVVGHTEYDTTSGILSISPLENALQSEIFAARLKIN